MSQLRRDVTRFVDFAMRTLRHESGVGSSVEPQRSRLPHPRFHEHIGVFNGDFVKDFIALTREFLHDVHVGGMEEASSSQPRPGLPSPKSMILTVPSRAIMMFCGFRSR